VSGVFSIAALFLATGAAQASIHRSFHQCGKYLVTGAWDWNQGNPVDNWSLLFQRNGVWKIRPLSGRLFKQTCTDFYFRGFKCSEALSFSQVPEEVKDLIWIKPPELPTEPADVCGPAYSRPCE